MEQKIIDELKNNGAHVVETTRKDVRSFMDGDINQLDEELSTALDDAQGSADEDGKTSYVIIQVRGSAL